MQEIEINELLLSYTSVKQMTLLELERIETEHNMNLHEQFYFEKLWQQQKDYLKAKKQTS